MPGTLEGTRFQDSAPGTEIFVDLGMALQVVQNVYTGSHRNGVSRQCARLIDVPERGYPLHDIRPAPEGTDGETSADYLAQARQVRFYPQRGLDPSKSGSEARDHLIKDNENGPVTAQTNDRFQKTFAGRHNAHVPHNGFENYAGYVIALLHNGGYAFNVVKLGDVGMFCKILRDTFAVGDTKGGQGPNRL